MAFPAGAGNLSLTQTEAIVHGFLQSQGDVFAFQRQSELGESNLRAIVEFSDIDVAVAVASNFNGCVVNVSAPPPPNLSV